MSVHTALTQPRCCGVSASANQRRRTVLAATLTQAHDVAVDDIRQHRPELVAFAALNLIDADVARAPLRPHHVPPTQEGHFGAARGAPAHPMTHRRMTSRHRLTIEANQLLQATRRPSLRIGEFDPLGSNPTVATAYTPLLIHQRHRMGGPRQVVPSPLLQIACAAGPSTTAAAGVALNAAAFNMNPEVTVGRIAVPGHLTTRKPGKPRIQVHSRRDPTRPPLLVAHQQ
jgi:hypothetical protein